LRGESEYGAESGSAEKYAISTDKTAQKNDILLSRELPACGFGWFSAGLPFGTAFD